jgi:hypothetical protein
MNAKEEEQEEEEEEGNLSHQLRRKKVAGPRALATPSVVF